MATQDHITGLPKVVIVVAPVAEDKAARRSERLWSLLVSGAIRSSQREESETQSREESYENVLSDAGGR